MGRSRHRHLAFGVAQASRRLPLGPHSTGPAEQVIRRLKLRMVDRALNYTNRARMDRLLELYACDLNGWVDELTWADIIRDHTERLGGIPQPPRTIADRKGQPSLR